MKASQLTIDQKLDFLMEKSEVYEKKLGKIDQRFDQMDQRFDELELKVDKLQRKTNRQYKELEKRIVDLQDMVAADLNETNQGVTRVEEVLHLPPIKPISGF
jgi:conjugal transfer/entry exclusion protein